jgi:hypothetical protein
MVRDTEATATNRCHADSSRRNVGCQLSALLQRRLQFCECERRGWETGKCAKTASTVQIPAADWEVIENLDGF